MKVKRMIKSDVDTFKVGDIIKVKLTDGVKVQAMAMQQEEDGMIFCLVDCLPGEYPMNSTSTNEGGYEESDLRKKLNGEILNLFPAEAWSDRQAGYVYDQCQTDKRVPASPETRETMDRRKRLSVPGQTAQTVYSAGSI